MLNENLSRIRKEKGLTQEALAVKLNVVRQTISKWEKGTAVPDADVLCKIAEALDTSIDELLGISQEEKPHPDVDVSTLARSLAEINEQLAISNRRSRRIWKTVGIVFLSVFFGFILLIVFNISMFTFNHKSSVETTAEEHEIYEVLYYENGFPIISSFSKLSENSINEVMVGIYERAELAENWGTPVDSYENEDMWAIDTDYFLIVGFNEDDYVIYVSKIKQSYYYEMKEQAEKTE